MFNLSINKELTQVAKRASEFARRDNHKDAARMRRLTRHAVEKTDEHLERAINILFGWLAFGAIVLILLYINIYR